MNAGITIRRAETTADYRALQAAQRAAWGIVEEGYVVPIATMVGAQLHGGLVLGAFLPDGEAVGVSRQDVSGVAERQLSKSRSWLAAGIVAGALAVATAIVIKGTAGPDPSTKPTGGGPQPD